MKPRISLFAFFLFAALTSQAQQTSALDSAIHEFTQIEDANAIVPAMNSIIQNYHLDKSKDAETFDLLYGTAAVNFAMQEDYPAFEKYIDSITNQFNRTSFMNMAASKLLNDSVDVANARRIAKETLTLYRKMKEDSTARPENFSRADWKRFMDFAQYPYYDTYAQALFAAKQYDSALHYQAMAFPDKPDNGMPGSVERYAQLLQLTGKKEEAKQLLLQMAAHGKLTSAMTSQLQSIYISEKGSDESLGLLLDSLQINVQHTLAQELKPKMMNVTAPAFTLKDIYGKQVSLSGFRGRIVVLDLWATWCRPCIASFPAMQMLVKKHPEITFLFIAVEERDANPLPAVKSFIEKRNYPFTVLLDEPVKPHASDYKIISSYRPDGIPAKYIIDKNGILRFTTNGFSSDSELINELEAMFSLLQ